MQSSVHDSKRGVAMAVAAAAAVAASQKDPVDAAPAHAKRDVKDQNERHAQG